MSFNRVAALMEEAKELTKVEAREVRAKLAELVPRIDSLASTGMPRLIAKQFQAIGSALAPALEELDRRMYRTWDAWEKPDLDTLLVDPEPVPYVQDEPLTWVETPGTPALDDEIPF